MKQQLNNVLYSNITIENCINALSNGFPSSIYEFKSLADKTKLLESSIETLNQDVILQVILFLKVNRIRKYLSAGNTISSSIPRYHFKIQTCCSDLQKSFKIEWKCQSSHCSLSIFRPTSRRRTSFTPTSLSYTRCSISMYFVTPKPSLRLNALKSCADTFSKHAALRWQYEQLKDNIAILERQILIEVCFLLPWN